VNDKLGLQAASTARTQQAHSHVMIESLMAQKLASMLSAGCE
jgi:hypothetical protein